MLRSTFEQLAPIPPYPSIRICPRTGSLLALEIMLMLGSSHPIVNGAQRFSWPDLLSTVDITVDMTRVRCAFGAQIADPVSRIRLGGWEAYAWSLHNLYIPLGNAASQIYADLRFADVVAAGEGYLVVTQWWCDETDLPTVEVYARSIRDTRMVSSAILGGNSSFSTVGIAATSPPITYQPPANSPVTKPRRRAPGPVVGFKLLGMKDATDGVLHSPVQGTRWDTREMQTPWLDFKEPEDVNTGIYSYYSLADLVASDTWTSVKDAFVSRLVVVAVLCTGALALHDRGMRSERARILAVLKPPHSVFMTDTYKDMLSLRKPTLEHHRLIRQVAKRYRVPVLRRRNFDRYTSEWLVGKKGILAAMEDVT